MKSDKEKPRKMFARIARLDSSREWWKEAAWREGNQGPDGCDCPDCSRRETRVIEIPVLDNKEFIIRESKRFASREYCSVPWRLTWIGDVLSDHFAHFSLEHPGMVAYTPDEDYAAKDRKIRMRPGRYLRRFLGDLLSEAEIDKWCAACKPYTKDDLKIARTADEIVWVYTHGPESCMSCMWNQYNLCGGHHPVEPYGDSDIQIAYICSTEDPDNVIARCVISEKRNIYGRSYGDTALLTRLLRDKGYECAYPDRNERWCGLSLRRINLPSGRILCPYLDVGPRVLLQEGALIIIASNGYGTSTTGVLIGADDEPFIAEPDENLETCVRCGAGCPEISRVDSEDWCEVCTDMHALACEFCNRLVPTADTGNVDGESWCTRCTAAHAIFCTGCCLLTARSSTCTGVDSNTYCNYCAMCPRDCGHYDTKGTDPEEPCKECLKVQVACTQASFYIL